MRTIRLLILGLISVYSLTAGKMAAQVICEDDTMMVKFNKALNGMFDREYDKLTSVINMRELPIALNQLHNRASIEKNKNNGIMELSEKEYIVVQFFQDVCGFLSMRNSAGYFFAPNSIALVKWFEDNRSKITEKFLLDYCKYQARFTIINEFEIGGFTNGHANKEMVKLWTYAPIDLQDYSTYAYFYEQSELEHLLREFYAGTTFE